MRKKKLGSTGEEIATKYLEKRGYKIIERNFRTPRWGEIDIVALEGDTLAFVEVKTRSSKKYGEPAESLHFYKRRALKRAAQYYKVVHPDAPSSIRLDLVSIILDPETTKSIEIKLFKNIQG